MSREISKSDWKLFRQKIGEWQEDYMERDAGTARHDGAERRRAVTRPVYRAAFAHIV